MEIGHFDGNRPLQSTSDDVNPEKQRRQNLSYHFAVSTASSETNLTSTSSSSLLTSDFPRPSLLTSAQAALKRHRPLRSMQSEGFRARRVPPVQQVKPSKPPDTRISTSNTGSGWCSAAGSSSSSCRKEKISTENLPVSVSSVSSQSGEKIIGSGSLSVPTSEISSKNACIDGIQSSSVKENGLADDLHVSDVSVQQRQPSKDLDAPFVSIGKQVASGFTNAVSNQERNSQKEENIGGGTLPARGDILEIPASHQLHAPRVNMNFFAAHSSERILIPCFTMSSTCISTMSLDSGPVPQSNCAASGAMNTVPTGVSVASSQGSSAGPQSITRLDGFGNIETEVDRSTNYVKPSQFGEGAGEKVVRGDPSSSLAPVPPIKCSSSNIDAHSSKPSRGEKGPRKKKYNPDLFIEVNGKLYQKLGKIGTGGSSEVYKVIASDCTIYALKMIKLKGRDYPTAFGFYQEIEYLNKLKGRNNIIQLVDYEVTDKTLFEEVIVGSMTKKDTRIKVDIHIYMLLEYGEIDLAHMLSQTLMDTNNPGWNIKENWIRFYWQQMLQAVNTIHEERIVHSDLKPANFMLVKGSLKLIDFGIAKAISSDTTNIQRDSQVGTLNYMSPEAFGLNEEDASGSTIKCGRPSDIWSLGCILYQMVYGKTPFAEYKTFWSKFKVITDCSHGISYPPTVNPWLIDLMKKCLAWNRDERWKIPQLVQHPFLNPPIIPLE